MKRYSWKPKDTKKVALLTLSKIKAVSFTLTDILEGFEKILQFVSSDKERMLVTCCSRGQRCDYNSTDPDLRAVLRGQVSPSGIFSLQSENTFSPFLAVEHNELQKPLIVSHRASWSWFPECLKEQRFKKRHPCSFWALSFMYRKIHCRYFQTWVQPCLWYLLNVQAIPVLTPPPPFLNTVLTSHMANVYSLTSHTVYHHRKMWPDKTVFSVWDSRGGWMYRCCLVVIGQKLRYKPSRAARGRGGTAFRWGSPQCFSHTWQPMS